MQWGPGIAGETGLRKKGRVRTLSMHSTALMNGNGKDHAAMEVSASQCDAVVLEAQLWKMLPEEILDRIRARLPVTSQFRFRCVSRKWNEIEALTPPPPCLIVNGVGGRNPQLFCDSTKKWFDLPSNRHLPAGKNWELADADAGIVCYSGQKDGYLMLWVCNPLKPSLSRLIESCRDNDPAGRQLRHGELCELKLLVDRANKSFKIIVTALVNSYPWSWIGVYESSTSAWTLGRNTNSILSRPQFFACGNTFYVSEAQKAAQRMYFLVEFNAVTRTWRNIKLEIPFAPGFSPSTHQFFLGDNDGLLLVAFSQREQRQPDFSIWKLQNEGFRKTEDGLLLVQNLQQQNYWEKATLGPYRATVDLAHHSLVCASYGAGHVSFVFRDEFEHMTEDGHSFPAHKCVRYSFTAKCWSVIPSPKEWGSGESVKLYNWEPSLDTDPSFT